VSFGRVDLVLSLLGLAAATVAAALAVLRTPAQPDGDRRVAWLLGAGAFALVCGASLCTVDRFAFSHPFWDQWWEARTLYVPFVEGRYTWSDLLQPHNEHRIALTRLWALALFKVRWLWDNRTVATANAFLHAVTVGLLVAAVALRERFRDALLLALVLVIPASLPLAFENVLHGFQSQFYFLLLYGFLALWLMTHEQPSRAGFWLGALCAFLAVFSVGSGFTASIALLLAALLESARDRSVLRERAPLITVAVTVAAVGWFCRVHVGYLEAAHANSLGQLARLALRCWSFPLVDWIWPALLLWVPFAVWLVTLVRDRRRWTPDERFLCALGVFVSMHGVMIGWARANESPRPAGRYFDVLALGLFVNAWALVAWSRARSTPLRKATLAGWLVLAALGTTLLATRTFRDDLPYHDLLWSIQEKNLREYLSKGRPEALRQPDWQIPHWNSEDLRALLDDPFIRGVLPWSIRPDSPPPGTFSGRIGPVKLVVLATGFLLWLAAWLRHRRLVRRSSGRSP
jgi:hypothetical protein